MDLATEYHEAFAVDEETVVIKGDNILVSFLDILGI